MKQGSHVNDGGETPGRRDAMDRMTRQLVEHGKSVDEARRIVERCAVQADRIAERKANR